MVVIVQGVVVVVAVVFSGLCRSQRLLWGRIGLMLEWLGGSGDRRAQGERVSGSERLERYQCFG